MRHRELLRILNVGLPEALPDAPHVETLEAMTGKQAIAAMRVMRFDLLLAGEHVPDTSVWSLIHRVRLGWPGQHWALVSEQETPETEMRARSLGALCVYSRVPGSEELTMLNDALQSPTRATVRPDAEIIAASKAS